MNTQKFSEKEITQKHFAEARFDLGYTSVFRALLRDARQVTRRDLDTGMKLEGSHTFWLGALGYLILLDQIGTCFKPRNKPSVSGSPLIRALTYFSALQKDERDAIYALRCSLAHGYSLINLDTRIDTKSKVRRTEYTHRFKLTGDEIGPIVILPKSKWDGDYSNKNTNNQTVIDIVLLGDLVENICKLLDTMSKADQLEVILSKSSEELDRRYSLYFGPPSP